MSWTCRDCAHYMAADGECIEWNRPVPHDAPYCARFTAISGEGGPFGRPIITREITPREPTAAVRLDGSGWLKWTEEGAGKVGRRQKQRELREKALSLLVDHNVRRVDVAEAMGVHVSTLDLWIRDAIDSGKIVRIRQGQYEWAEKEDEQKMAAEPKKTLVDERLAEAVTDAREGRAGRDVSEARDEQGACEALKTIAEIEASYSNIMTVLEKHTQLLDILAAEVRDLRADIDKLRAEIETVKRQLEEPNSATSVEVKAGPIVVDPAMRALQALERIALGGRGSAA